MLITSVNNEYIKKINKLNSKKERDDTGLFLIEGDNLIHEAYKNNLLKEIILLADNISKYDVKVTYVTKEVMNKISSTDTIPTIMGIACKKKDDINIGNKILILDDIQDPGNLGTIIRSAVAFNIDTIVLSKNTVDLYNSKVLRSTGGMVFNINIIVRNLEDFISNLKKDNYIIFGTNVINGNNIKAVKIKDKYAIIIGNEGKGMNKNLDKYCDEYLYIKMDDKCESLNVGVATSIILYELDNG